MPSDRISLVRQAGRCRADDAGTEEPMMKKQDEKKLEVSRQTI
jgi:hypothetical protein